MPKVLPGQLSPKQKKNATRTNVELKTVRFKLTHEQHDDLVYMAKMLEMTFGDLIRLVLFHNGIIEEHLTQAQRNCFLRAKLAGEILQHGRDRKHLVRQLKGPGSRLEVTRFPDDWFD